MDPPPYNLQLTPPTRAALCDARDTCVLFDRIADSLGTAMLTKSVLVNPTAEDTLSLSRSIRLALEYADDLQNGKPVANYLWFSKSPKVNMIPRMVNPEDKGWLESINLYDLKGAAPG